MYHIHLHRVGGYSKMKSLIGVKVEGEFKMEKVTLNVQGMSCEHCVKAVEGSVGALNGVSSVKVNLKAATVDVEFNQQEVTLVKIKETIDEQGYDVK